MALNELPVDIGLRPSPDRLGTIASITIARDHASMNFVEDVGGPTTITFYRNAGKAVLTPSEGMWRGAMLGIAQRALTHGHMVSVRAHRRTVPGRADQDQVLESITIHKVED